MLKHLTLLAAGIGLLPAAGVAQAHDQLQTLLQTAKLCTDPSIMPGDWDSALVGWTPVKPEGDLRARIVADSLLQEGERDEFDGVAGAIATQMELVSDQEWDLGQFEENYSPELHGFYQHDSGWLLVLYRDMEDPAPSVCTLSHMDPAASVIAEVERPYMAVSPHQLTAGRAISATTLVPDQRGLAQISYRSFVRDPDAMNMEILPKGHPAHYASGLSYEIQLTSGSRGEH